MSDVVDSYEKGLLYKFRPPTQRSLEIITKQELYFAGLDALNDPFECALFANEESTKNNKKYQAFISAWDEIIKKDLLK